MPKTTRRRPAPDPEVTFDQAVTELPDNFLQCRDLSHSFRPFSAKFDDKAKAYDQVLKCSRCGTLRHRVIDSRGFIVSSSYDYKDGYLIRGAGRLSADHRATMRLTGLLRTLEKKQRLRAV